MSKHIVRTIIAFLVLWLPATTAAQFIPIGEARKLGSLEDQREIDSVFNKIAQRGASAGRRIDAVLSEVESLKSDTVTAQRKIDSIMSDLKAELNAILSDYARQSPPANNMREAFKVAQTTLDDPRRRVEEELEKARIKRQANPEQLTGKYLAYQQRAKPIIEKALANADARLKGRGTKTTVTKDLENVVTDATRQLDLAAASFMSDHPELLETTIRRINKQFLDSLSAGMESRFKLASERGTERKLDLTEEELARYEASVKEMEGIVERAINSAETLARQTASTGSANDPQRPWLDPALEAKYKAAKQIEELKKSVTTRLDTITTQFSALPDISQLAKDLLKEDQAKLKGRLTDSLDEFHRLLIAGEIPEAEYQRKKKAGEAELEARVKKKQELQDQIENLSLRGQVLQVASCNKQMLDAFNPPKSGGFFSSLLGLAGPIGAIFGGPAGGAIGSVAGGLLGGLTGANQQGYSSPNACGGSGLPNVGGRYVAPGLYGNQSIPNPCFSRGGGLVSKAYAQGAGDLPDVLSDFSFGESLIVPFSPSGGGNGGDGGLGGAIGAIGGLIGGGNGGNRGGGGGLGNFGQFLPLIGGLLGGGGGGGFGQFPCNPINNAASSFSNPFGGFPVQQWMGIPNGSNLGFNVPSSNVGSFLGQGFNLAAAQNPQLSPLASLFSGGQPFTFNNFSQIQQDPNFNRLQPTDPFWRQPTQQTLLNLCLYGFLNNDRQIQDYCRRVFMPQGGFSTGATPPIIPGGGFNNFQNLPPFQFQ